MVTTVPPAAGPPEGWSLCTTGAAPHPLGDATSARTHASVDSESARPPRDAPLDATRGMTDVTRDVMSDPAREKWRRRGSVPRERGGAGGRRGAGKEGALGEACPWAWAAGWAAEEVVTRGGAGAGGAGEALGEACAERSCLEERSRRTRRRTRRAGRSKRARWVQMLGESTAHQRSRQGGRGEVVSWRCLSGAREPQRETRRGAGRRGCCTGTIDRRGQHVTRRMKSARRGIAPTAGDFP